MGINWKWNDTYTTTTTTGDPIQIKAPEWKIGDKIEAYNADKVIFDNLRCKPFGYLKITNIEYIRFDEINKEIARTEGYLHEDLLKETLYEIYDEIKPSTLLYYIQFEFISLEDEDNEPTE